MAEIFWTVAASEDLFFIESFVAQDSPVYAARLVDRIVESVERLSSFPHSGRMVPEFQREALREVISGSYRVVYLLRGSEVFILRVLHGARDLLEVAERGPWEPPD